MNFSSNFNAVGQVEIEHRINGQIVQSVFKPNNIMANAKKVALHALFQDGKGTVNSWRVNTLKFGRSDQQKTNKTLTDLIDPITSYSVTFPEDNEVGNPATINFNSNLQSSPFVIDEVEYVLYPSLKYEIEIPMGTTLVGETIREIALFNVRQLGSDIFARLVLDSPIVVTEFSEIVIRWFIGFKQFVEIDQDGRRMVPPDLDDNIIIGNNPSNFMTERVVILNNIDYNTGWDLKYVVFGQDGTDTNPTDPAGYPSLQPSPLNPFDSGLKSPVGYRTSGTINANFLMLDGSPFPDNPASPQYYTGPDRVHFRLPLLNETPYEAYLTDVNDDFILDINGQFQIIDDDLEINECGVYTSNGILFSRLIFDTDGENSTLPVLPIERDPFISYSVGLTISVE